MMVGQNNDGGVYQMGLDGTLGSGQPAPRNYYLYQTDRTLRQILGWAGLFQLSATTTS